MPLPSCRFNLFCQLVPLSLLFHGQTSYVLCMSAQTTIRFSLSTRSLGTHLFFSACETLTLVAIRLGAKGRAKGITGAGHVVRPQQRLQLRQLPGIPRPGLTLSSLRLDVGLITRCFFQTRLIELFQNQPPYGCLAISSTW
jgi:hypothetical protein